VGILYAVGNTISNIGGILAPMVAGWLLGGHEDEDYKHASKEQWQHVFCLSAAICGAAVLVWSVFMQGRPVQALN
jgi:sugar phosphate permease